MSLALGLGFVLGLKHATEADHVVAVSTIVGEQRSVLRSAWVGALWGIGHSLALLTAGILALALEIVIPERLARLLEFGVAIMILSLGARTLWLVLRGRSDLHLHTHIHDGRTHAHLHFHGPSDAHPVLAADRVGGHSHEVKPLGLKPLFVGVMHGFAGSAALTLLLIGDVVRGGSRALGVAYLLLFGLGSIGGMMGMSALISLPFSLTSARYEKSHVPLRLIAGAGSVVFGLYYAWHVGL